VSQWLTFKKLGSQGECKAQLKTMPSFYRCVASNDPALKTRRQTQISPKHLNRSRRRRNAHAIAPLLRCPTEKKVREMPLRHFTSFFLLRTPGAGVTPAAHRAGD